MMVNPIGRLSANNAAFNMMSASNSLMGLCSFGGNSASISASEKRLTLSMLNNDFAYKVSLCMDKFPDDDTKRRLSVFA